MDRLNRAADGSVAVLLLNAGQFRNVELIARKLLGESRQQDVARFGDLYPATPPPPEAAARMVQGSDPYRR